jgi:hypothetical protein
MRAELQGAKGIWRSWAMGSDPLLNKKLFSFNSFKPYLTFDKHGETGL